MTARVRVGVTVWLLVALGLALPAVAGAHASLLRTTPSASVVTNGPPAQVTLTYSESIEPRFSIVSVTDVNGHQVTSGPPAREPGSPQTLVVPLRKIPPGWYLVLWRVISADGHPVRGAFTFAVGPSPGSRAAVRDPVALGDGGDSRARRLALRHLRRDDARDRAVRVPHADRAPGPARRARHEPASGVDRVRRRARGLARQRPDLRDRVDREVRAAVVVRPRHADPARPRLELRAQLRRPLDPPGAVRRGGARRDRGRPPDAIGALDRRAARDGVGADRGRRGARDSGHRGARGPDLSGRPRARPRLGAPGERVAVARRAPRVCSCCGSRRRQVAAARRSRSSYRASRRSRSSR